MKRSEGQNITKPFNLDEIVPYWEQFLFPIENNFCPLRSLGDKIRGQKMSMTHWRNFSLATVLMQMKSSYSMMMCTKS